jgi:hypothetical protein
MSRKKNRQKKATVDRSVQITRMVVNMNQPARKKPMAWLRSSGVEYADTISKPPGVRIIAYEIQNAPYDEKAVAPNVLPTAISLSSIY